MGRVREKDEAVEQVANDAAVIRLDAAPNQKKCTKCGIQKELECFHKNAHKTDGLSPNCKSCVSASKSRSYKRKSKAAKRRKSAKSSQVLNMSDVKIEEHFVKTDLFNYSELEDLINGLISASLKTEDKDEKK